MTWIPCLPYLGAIVVLLGLCLDMAYDDEVRSKCRLPRYVD